MAIRERKIADLDGLEYQADASNAMGFAAPKTAPLLEPVDINYPEPTPLGVIIKEVARWSGRNFVMEPGLNAKLQIFAPRKMPPQKAYELFVTSLSVVGLRAVQVSDVIKIVPVQVLVVA